MNNREDRQAPIEGGEQESFMNEITDYRTQFNASKAQVTILIAVVILIGVIAVTAMVGVIVVILDILPRMQNEPIQADIVFLHFSDFYQIEGIPASTEDKSLGKGGLARLATVVKSQTVPTIISFGGDLFSPSALTTFLGAPLQMMEGFNKLNTLAPVVAVAGNHEFDKVPYSRQWFTKFNFPWLLANFYELNTTTPINGTKATYIISFEGIKIGFIGLGFDYRTTTPMTANDATYEDFLVVAERWVKQLKTDAKVDFIIALTHLPIPSEQDLLKKVPGIDLCLAGHDHIFYNEVINGHSLVEGDIDLSTLAIVTLSYFKGTSPLIRQVTVDYIVVDDTIPKDPDMQVIVDKWVQQFESESTVVIGNTAVTLHADKKINRCKETNVGDFVTDSIRQWAIDTMSKKEFEPLPIVGLVNSGSLRWNADIAAGSNLTKGNVLNLLPFGSTTCVLLITGDVLRKSLENSVSQLPLSGGRFTQISGFNFSHTCKIDPNTGDGKCNTNAGSRVLNITLQDGTEVSDTTRLYLVCTDYMAYGGDEYSLLPIQQIIIDSESGDSLFDIILQQIQNQFTIAPEEDGRIIETGPTNSMLFK